MKKGRFLSPLLCLALMLGMMVAMSITTFAGTLKIGKSTFTGEMRNRTWEFVPGDAGESAILTLNNYEFVGEGNDTNNAAIAYDGDLTIIVSGLNHILNTSESIMSNRGIYVEGKLIIKGNGVLDVIAGACTAFRGGSAGILVSSAGPLNIQGQVTVNAKGGRADDSHGISCSELNISGATVKASGADYASDHSCGVDSPRIYISNKGSLEAVGGALGGGAKPESYGLNLRNGSIKIKEGDGSVLAAGFTKAINGIVQNTVLGFGWADQAGSGTRNDISASDSGQDLGFKKVVFPAIKNKVTFKVVNGAWNDGTAAAKTVSLTGVGSIPELSAGVIPTVGSKPDSGYKEGNWAVTPKAGTLITEDTTYTYTYAQKETATAEAPTANTLTYTGKAQALVTAGKVTGGTLYYALGTAAKATESYTTSIPKGTNKGTYYVWYKAVGDSNHNDSAPQCVRVTISAAGSPDNQNPGKKDPENVKNQTVTEKITISKRPASVKAKIKKKSKSKVIVSWKKIKKNKAGKKLLKKIKSIQVQYSTDKTFKKNVKTKTVGKKKTKVTLKLQKKTTYYIRVRYKGSDGFSKWSKVKRVKTKK